MSQLQTIYIVIDLGFNSPCSGILFGTFTNYAEATAYAKEINANPDKFGLWGSDDFSIAVHTCPLNQRLIETDENVCDN